MTFQFAAFVAFIAVACAGVVPSTQVYHAAPATNVYHTGHAAIVKTHPVLAKIEDEFDPHPQYKYGYDVQDAVSGDSKSQVEERDGDVVRGEYSLIDADGYKRTVHYTADPINGFNAVVNREPLAVKAVAVPTVVKTVAHHAVPTVVKTVAPIAHYAAPAFTTYSAPATYVAHH